MFGAFSRSPQLGIDFVAFQKLARLAGVDHLHTNGIHNKFYESDAEVLRSIAGRSGADVRWLLDRARAVQRPDAALAHDTYAAVGTSDILVMAGGGIHGHPMGSGRGSQHA